MARLWCRVLHEGRAHGGAHPAECDRDGMGPLRLSLRERENTGFVHP